MHNLIGQLASASLVGKYSFLNLGSAGLQDSNAAPATATNALPQTNVTPDAVAPTQDTVDISPEAQTFGDLQSIINAVNQAQDGNTAKAALSALKTFVDENTNASFVDDMLGKLGDMVDKVLDALDKDPNALGNYVSMSLNIDFKQKTQSSGDFYRDRTSLNVSFSLDTQNLDIKANLGFNERSSGNDHVSRYRSREYASISITATNSGVSSNTAMDTFASLRAVLFGQNAGSILNPPAAPAPAPVPTTPTTDTPATDDTTAQPTAEAPDSDTVTTPAEASTNATIPLPPAHVDIMLNLRIRLKGNDDGLKLLQQLMDKLNDFLESLLLPQAEPVAPATPADNQNEEPPVADNENTAPVAPAEDTAATA